MNHAFCKLIQMDELPAIKIEHPRFNAILLLQGAQLIEFRQDTGHEPCFLQTNSNGRITSN